MNRAERRRARRDSDELTRDEVWVPPLREYPEEWSRNNAVFGNRLIRRTGPVGRIFGWVLVVGIALAFLSQLVEGVIVLFGG